MNEVKDLVGSFGIGNQERQLRAIHSRQCGRCRRTGALCLHDLLLQDAPMLPMQECGASDVEEGAFVSILNGIVRMMDFFANCEF